MALVKSEDWCEMVLKVERLEAKKAALEEKLAEANAKNSELLREKGAAWGVKFCCNGYMCSCQGQPVGPPTWWHEQEATIAAYAERLGDCLKIADEYTEKEQEDHEQFRPYSSPMFYAQAIRDKISDLLANLPSPPDTKEPTNNAE